MIRPLILLAVATALVGCDAVCPDTPGTTCVVAGTGLPGFNGDGEDPATRTLYEPMDIVPRPGTTDLVIPDWNNHRIRLVSEGAISTLVGTILPGDGDPADADRTTAGAPGTEVGLNHPTQAMWDADGMLVLANWHNHRIRTWDPSTSLVHVVAADTPSSAGSGANSGFAGDNGPAMAALLFLPSDITQDQDGAYWLIDQKNQRVRKIQSDWGTINTIAGFTDPQTPSGFAGDGGPLVDARFHFPVEGGQPLPGGGILAGADGKIYVADTGNHCIRVIDVANDRIDRVAGVGVAGMSGDGAAAVDAELSGPTDLEWGPDGRLYFADTQNHVIRAVDLESGVIETVVGSGTPEEADRELDGEDDGLGVLDTPLDHPYGLGFDDDGVLHVADTRNHVIRRVIL